MYVLSNQLPNTYDLTVDADLWVAVVIDALFPKPAIALNIAAALYFS